MEMADAGKEALAQRNHRVIIQLKQRRGMETNVIDCIMAYRYHKSPSRKWGLNEIVNDN